MICKKESALPDILFVNPYYRYFLLLFQFLGGWSPTCVVLTPPRVVVTLAVCTRIATAMAASATMGPKTTAVLALSPPRLLQPPPWLQSWLEKWCKKSNTAHQNRNKTSVLTNFNHFSVSRDQFLNIWKPQCTMFWNQNTEYSGSWQPSEVLKFHPIWKSIT